MANEQLIAYFLDCLKNNHSTDDGQVILAHQGWTNEQIQEALSIAGLRFENLKLADTRRAVGLPVGGSDSPSPKKKIGLTEILFRLLATIVVLSFLAYIIFFVNLPAYDTIQKVPSFAKLICIARGMEYQSLDGTADMSENYSSSIQCIK